MCNGTPGLLPLIAEQLAEVAWRMSAVGTLAI